MALSREDIAALQTAFETDATAAAFATAGPRLLVLANDGSRIVHAGEEATGLAQAITAADGSIDPANPAADRLRQLARGLAPRRGSRLELLPFDPAGATSAHCRSVVLVGRSLLVCALVPPILAPALQRQDAEEEPLLPFDAAVPEASGSPEIEEDAQPDLAAARDDEPAPLAVEPSEPPQGEPGEQTRLEALRAKGVVRFLWQADPHTRFTHVTAALAEAVGAEAGDIVGRTWADLAAERVADPSGIIRDVLARRETWSGRTVSWRVDDEITVPVDLAGMPVLDRNRELVGYRGFGLIRADAAIFAPRPAPEPEAAVVHLDDGPLAPPAEQDHGGEIEEAPTEETPAEEAPAAAAFGEVLHVADQLESPGDEDVQAVSGETDASEAELTDAVEADLEDWHWDQDISSPEEALTLTHEGEGEDAPIESGPVEPDAEPAAGIADEAAAEESVPAAMTDGPPGEDFAEPSILEPEAAEAGPDLAAAEAEPVPVFKVEPEAREQTPTAEPLAPPRADNDAPGSNVFALSGKVRARFGEAAPPPLRAVEPATGATGATVPPPSGARPATPGVPRLSMSERSAFREIAKALGARFEDETAFQEEAAPAPPQAAVEDLSGADAAPEQSWSSRDRLAEEAPQTPSAQEARETAGDEAPEETDFARIIERLPVGILIHRGDTLLLVNRALREMTGYESMAALAEEGGLQRIFHGRAGALAVAELDPVTPMALGTRRGESVPVEIRLTTVDWADAPASLMLIRRMPDADAGLKLRALELDLRSRDSRLREMSAILDTATDGVIVVDDVGRILSLNRSAEALFGYDQNEVTGEPVTILLSPESHAVALDYLDGLRSNGVASLLNDGREVAGRVRQGGSIPLFMTMGQITERPNAKYCAVLRDITAFKKAEGELLAAKRAAEEASAQKSDFLAKISHEIRTPLNAIIGFAEVMLEERFGPVGSERYRDYLRDIHGSGEHVISLVNDLLDLAKVEAGRMELSFTGVGLNDLVTNCVALMQPQASRERIVMRTSFAPKLPPVVADERSLRQIVLNLVSNAIKFTDAGGQVIVSTAMTDRGEVAFRVRDTGIGMSGTEIEAALEPFRQLATSRKGGGTGLGLPLTKALVEANRGALQISSNKGEGTLVEVLFPPTRVLAE